MSVSSTFRVLCSQADIPEYRCFWDQQFGVHELLPCACNEGIHVRTHTLAHMHQRICTHALAHTHQRVRTHALAHTHQRVRTHTLAHTHQRVRTHALAHTHQHVCTHAPAACMHASLVLSCDACTYLRMDTPAHTHACMPRHVCMHAPACTRASWSCPVMHAHTYAPAPQHERMCPASHPTHCLLPIPV